MADLTPPVRVSRREPDRSLAGRVGRARPRGLRAAVRARRPLRGPAVRRAARGPRRARRPRRAPVGRFPDARIERTGRAPDRRALRRRAVQAARHPSRRRSRGCAPTGRFVVVHLRRPTASSTPTASAWLARARLLRRPTTPPSSLACCQRAARSASARCSCCAASAARCSRPGAQSRLLGHRQRRAIPGWMRAHVLDRARLGRVNARPCRCRSCRLEVRSPPVGGDVVIGRVVVGPRDLLTDLDRDVALGSNGDVLPS